MVVAHLALAAWRSGKRRLFVNLLSGATEPPELMTPEVRPGVAYYLQLFPDMVARSNSDIAFVTEATLTLDFEPHIHNTGLLTGRVASTYRCCVHIVDDRGKTYERVIVGSAASERSPLPSVLVRLKRLFTRE